MRLVRIVSLTGIDEGQHHKDEGLQHDDQDVEQRPNSAGNDVACKQQDARSG